MIQDNSYMCIFHVLPAVSIYEQVLCGWLVYLALVFLVSSITNAAKYFIQHCRQLTEQNDFFKCCRFPPGTICLTATGNDTFYRWVLLEEPFQRCSVWASSQDDCSLSCCQLHRRTAAENWTSDCSQSQHSLPAITTIKLLSLKVTITGFAFTAVLQIGYNINITLLVLVLHGSN